MGEVEKHDARERLALDLEQLAEVIREWPTHSRLQEWSELLNNAAKVIRSERPERRSR